MCHTKCRGNIVNWLLPMDFALISYPEKKYSDDINVSFPVDNTK